MRPRFDEQRGCPKCGSGYVVTKHGSQYRFADDYLHRKCERCGYAWAETPLDHPESPESAPKPPEADADA